MTGGYFGPTYKPQIHKRWLGENIPWTAKLDDVALKWLFFYFNSSCLLGNNWSMLTCKRLVAIRVVFVIGAYDWGSLSYGFFIAYLRQALRYLKVFGRFWIGGCMSTSRPCDYNMMDFSWQYIQGHMLSPSAISLELFWHYGQLSALRLHHLGWDTQQSIWWRVVS